MDYVDFDLEIDRHDGQTYAVSVRSPVGEARTTAPLPFTAAQLEAHLLRLENALLRHVGPRRQILTPDEQAVQSFGEALFAFVFSGEPSSLYRECQREAGHRGQGVRLKLRIHPPELAMLPWEFLYDPRRADYLCLDANTPLVRYLDLAQVIRPLAVAPPLRILSMVASPSDQEPLDVETERRRLDQALAGLQTAGSVELHWLAGQTWRDLQQALRHGPWHIFHFIGHGGFDAQRDQGLLLFTGDDGRAHRISATQLSRLLARQRDSLRLVLLNACEGARGGRQDLFSGTAATLVRSGIPAVLAMQYAITDAAAIEFARIFYGALADDLPVDTAVSDARNAINLRNERSLEWGTPVLYMRAADGRIFALEPEAAIPGESSPAARQPAVVKPRAQQPETKPQAQPAFAIEFDWVTIPAGEFLMGSDKQKDPAAYDDELPQHKVYVDTFRIARVPVTVAQFEFFVKATAYQTTAEREGWSSVWSGYKWDWVEGADWAHPHGPHSDVAQKAKHPVTHISWHDAQEFCQWANVRLPTEAEWEKAARGTDGCIYPWGDKPPNDGRCNFSMNGGDTTPVGNYPAGASPYDVLDMAGNVWEWTGSLWGRDSHEPDFRYPYDPADGRENLVTPGRVCRVVRGGSFYQPSRLRALRLSRRVQPRRPFQGHTVFGSWSPAFDLLISAFL